MPEEVKSQGLRANFIVRLVLAPAYILYRIWFYVLAAIPIGIMFPFLLYSVLSPKTYSFFYWLARSVWAPFILYGMGCPPRIIRQEGWKSNPPQMIIANHTSMLDIMLMLRCCPEPFVFVGKKELEKIPVFGFFYRRVCILVDRGNAQSKAKVYRAVEERLQRGLHICIFPEGGVPEESVVMDRFKTGAFRMASQHQMDIAPLLFYDCKRRFSWSYFKGGPGPLRVLQLSSVSAEEMGQLEDVPNHFREMLVEELRSEKLWQAAVRTGN